MKSIIKYVRTVENVEKNGNDNVINEHNTEVKYITMWKFKITSNKYIYKTLW